MWTIRDITERARLERLKSEFVATASHELRSPLTSIKGFVELLSRSDGLDAKQREFLDVILLSTNRLVDLVNDLLDVARIEAGQFEIHRRPTDVVEAVREVATLIEPRIADKAQELDLQLPRVLPPALADPARVRQIATNLITNAHLYTPPRGRIAVGLEAEEHAIVLRVADNGRGMTAEEQEHIFDRFYRGADGRTRARHRARAVDRQVARRPARRHDRPCESEPDRGTTSPSGSRASRSREGGPLPREALRGRKVLVVDDEPDIAELIAEHLEPYEVETDDRALRRRGARAPAARALRRDDARHPDAGHERLRRARARCAPTRSCAARPVVFVSVYSGREALAGEWTVPKPIDAEELTDALGSAVLAGRTRVLVVGRDSVRPRARAVARAARPRSRLGDERRNGRAPVPGAPVRGRARRRRDAQSPDGATRARPARPPPAPGRARLHRPVRSARTSSPPSAPTRCRSRRPRPPCCRS